MDESKMNAEEFGNWENELEIFWKASSYTGHINPVKEFIRQLLDEQRVSSDGERFRDLLRQRATAELVPLSESEVYDVLKWLLDSYSDIGKNNQVLAKNLSEAMVAKFGTPRLTVDWENEFDRRANLPYKHKESISDLDGLDEVLVKDFIRDLLKGVNKETK